MLTHSLRACFFLLHQVTSLGCYSISSQESDLIMEVERCVFVLLTGRDVTKLSKETFLYTVQKKRSLGRKRLSLFLNRIRVRYDDKVDTSERYGRTK